MSFTVSCKMLRLLCNTCLYIECIPVLRKLHCQIEYLNDKDAVPITDTGYSNHVHFDFHKI